MEIQGLNPVVQNVLDERTVAERRIIRTEALKFAVTVVGESASDMTTVIKEAKKVAQYIEDGVIPVEVKK